MQNTQIGDKSIMSLQSSNVQLNFLISKHKLKGKQNRYMSLNIRNIAIIAHVDHGKTTLVDKSCGSANSLKITKFGRTFVRQ